MDDTRDDLTPDPAAASAGPTPTPDPPVTPPLPVDAPLDKKVGQSSGKSEWYFAFDEVDQKLSIHFVESCDTLMAFNLTRAETQALTNFLAICYQGMGKKKDPEPGPKNREHIRAS